MGSVFDKEKPNMMRITLKDLFKLTVLAFFWLAGTAISVAAEYYVSTTGDDTTGNGAITTPYQTIQHVLDNVAASGEIITDGQGFRVVLTPTDSPVGLPDEADMHSPDYAPDGSIVFEADWDGEQIWRLPVMQLHR